VVGWSDVYMNFELPSEKVKATRVNPKKIVIFSKPKIGKSTAISMLPNCLLIDLEDGSNFVDALKINVLKIAKEQDITPLAALKEVIAKIKEANKAKGGFVYKYGAIDTVSALEELTLVLANNLYRQTTMGRNWQGDDVRKLANGAGYQYTREALWIVLEELEDCFDTLIILGHTRDRIIEKNGKEMNERGLSLMGLSATILCGQVDAVGYMFREEGKENKTLVNFKPSESLASGSRSEHLKNKIVTLLESDEKGKLIDHWNEIFIDE